MSSKSVEMKLKSEPEDIEFDEEEDNSEILNDKFTKIKNLLETRIEKSKHLIGIEKDLSGPELTNSLLDVLIPGKAKQRDFIFFGKGI